jgi:hypothetical protein
MKQTGSKRWCLKCIERSIRVEDVFSEPIARTTFNTNFYELSTIEVTTKCLSIFVPFMPCHPTLLLRVRFFVVSGASSILAFLFFVVADS